MRATFDNTVSVLVKAYFNDELAHRICSACAVGNIVADAIGTKPKRNNNGVEFDNDYFEDGSPAMRGWYNELLKGQSNGGKEQIEATGYTSDELIMIEHAFEWAPGEPTSSTRFGIWRGKCTDPDWMFNGLMAVVKTLADIHGVDLETSQNAKKLFIKI